MGIWQEKSKKLDNTNIVISEPRIDSCDEGSKQLDNTRFEKSTTPPVEDQGKGKGSVVNHSLPTVTVFPPGIDYSSSSNEIDGNVYLAYAFPRTRQIRCPNPRQPDYRTLPEYTFRATVVTWSRKTGQGSLFIERSGTLAAITLEDIKPMYGALIIGTKVMFQIIDLGIQNFWVNDDRYYVLYREAAICEAQYPYMRYENESMQFDPDRDLFRRPRLDNVDVNTHMEVYLSRRYND